MGTWNAVYLFSISKPCPLPNRPFCLFFPDTKGLDGCVQEMVNAAVAQVAELHDGLGLGACGLSDHHFVMTSIY